MLVNVGHVADDVCSDPSINAMSWCWRQFNVASYENRHLLLIFS